MFLGYVNPHKNESSWVCWNVLFGMSQSSWLGYCLLGFAYLLSLLMWLVGGSSNQINVFIKELAKDSHKFPLTSVFFTSDSKLHVICLFWTPIYTLFLTVIIWNTVFITSAISILIVSCCYGLRSNVLQKPMSSVHTSNQFIWFNKITNPSMVNIMHSWHHCQGFWCRMNRLCRLDKARWLFVVICSYP